MIDTYLITGGAGNLACRMSFELVARGCRVVLLDVAPAPVAATAEGCDYVSGDLTDRELIRRVIAEHRPCSILHFASLLSAQSEVNRPAAWRLNMDASFELFEAALEFGVPQVLFPSSVASYGGQLPDPLPEDFPQWPEGLYGMTKVSVERLGVYYHVRHGLDFRSLRVPIVISGSAPIGAASAYVSWAFIAAVRKGQFRFKVRPETRPAVVYVKDVVRAMVELLAAPAGQLTRRVYNIHALAPTAAELADVIAARRPGVKLTFDPDPAVVRLIEGWPQTIVDESARRDWGWSPKWSLPDLADDFLAELA